MFVMFKKFWTLALTVSALVITSGCTHTAQEKSTAFSAQPPVLNDSPKIADFAPTPEKTDIKITYYSDNGETLKVIYHIDESSVTVIQLDGKEIILPQAIAASGIRFTKDEKTVFWSKGTTAQFYVDDKIVFSGREKE